MCLDLIVVDCRFSYILVDADFHTNKLADCRPERQKQCYLHLRGKLSDFQMDDKNFQKEPVASCCSMF